MSYENIQFQSQGGIARITLNRPDKLNSFTVAMHKELREAISKVNSDQSVRVLLLTGAGRGFCAGQDLNDRAISPGGAPVDLGAAVENWYTPLALSLGTLPMPVVCAVNGVAAGAGANLALACDLVIATQSAKFVQTFCNIGLIPDTGGTWNLPRLLGPARALGLAMCGDKLSADQAQEWGLIWKSVADAKFKDEVESLLAYLVKAPTLGLVRTKQLIRGSASMTLEEALAREGAAMRELGYSEDYREGVAAFLEKRPAQFTGR